MVFVHQLFRVRPCWNLHLLPEKVSFSAVWILTIPCFKVLQPGLGMSLTGITEHLSVLDLHFCTFLFFFIGHFVNRRSCHRFWGLGRFMVLIRWESFPTEMWSSAPASGLDRSFFLALPNTWCCHHHASSDRSFCQAEHIMPRTDSSSWVPQIKEPFPTSSTNLQHAFWQIFGWFFLGVSFVSCGFLLLLLYINMAVFLYHLEQIPGSWEKLQRGRTFRVSLSWVKGNPSRPSLIRYTYKHSNVLKVLQANQSRPGRDVM